MRVSLLLARLSTCLVLCGCFKTPLDVSLTDDPEDTVEGRVGTGDAAVVGPSPTDAGSVAARDAGPPTVAVITRPLTYYRDVKPIVDAKCLQCHVQGGLGHFSLATYDELENLAPVVRGDVLGGKMPPWRATGPLDKYVGDRRLTEEQKSIIISWIDQGAPPGDPSQAAPPVVPDRRGLPRVDSTLSLPAPFTPPSKADTYRCFVFEWPQQQTKFITGLSIEPGNKELVHHSILYLVPPSQVAAVRMREAADAEVGFECLTGVGLGSQWLTSYEPGGYGEENPGGLGFEVAPGSLLVLQMHYNTLRAGGSDSSKVQVMLADKVDRIGSVQLIMNQLWPLGFMAIPANAPDSVQTWTGRPLGLARDKSYDIFWADLHAHTLASQMYMGIVRAGQTKREPLLEIPDWAFEWQETFRLRQPVRLNPGDQLYVECHFDNTADKQLVIDGKQLPVRDVNWGEATTDEMCLGNVLATPAL